MTKGAYKILYIKSSSDFYPIGCLTENSFSESTEILDTTTRDNSDGWGSGVPTKQTFTISFSGMFTLDDRGSTVMDYATLQSLKRSRTKIEWKIYSSEGGDSESGYGYIISLSNVAPVEGNVTFSGEILGVDQPTTTEGIPEDINPIVEMIPIYEEAKYNNPPVTGVLEEVIEI